ncbi:MAG: efflux RND transporter permease subunit, partial [Candidatus Fimimonas sp.]
VIVDGNEYSDVANKVLEEVENTVRQTLSVSATLGGTAAEKAALRESIESEIVIISAIAVCLIAAIMLLTSKSWIEPLILLASSGVAMLINMGTNAFFGEISYITNSIAAILQLALSIDYSIVLLNKYRKEKETETDNEKAMKQAMKAVLKPVSASALTTIAGLLALLFMSFKIGFDIGIVLIKGIVISVFTSFTLLPALLLIFDKPMEKTHKRHFVPTGKKLCERTFRFSKVIVPVALVVIVCCCVLQTFNTYTFSDTKANKATTKTVFGQNNVVVVVYPKTADDLANEQKFIDSVSEYVTVTGTPVLKSYTANVNTVNESYDVAKAAQKLDLPENDVKLLLTMYHLYNGQSVELTPKEFVSYARYLMQNDQDAQTFVDEETSATINKLFASQELLDNSHTAEEFCNLLSSGEFGEQELSLFSVKQIYGLYHFNDVAEPNVNFQTMLNYVATSAQNPQTAQFFNRQTAENLAALSQGVGQFNAQMTMPMTKADFQGYMYQNYSTVIDDNTATQIFDGYYLSLEQTPQETIPFLELMTFLVRQGQISEAAAVETISSYQQLFAAINGSYGYEEFLPVLAQVAQTLVGEAVEVSTSSEAVQQIYILYFYENNLMPQTSILGSTLVHFVHDVSLQNSVVNEQLSDAAQKSISDLLIVNDFVSDAGKCDFEQMTQKLTLLQAQSSMENVGVLSKDKVSGVYVKYAAQTNETVEPVAAFELVDFVFCNMDENELLQTKMTVENRTKVLDAKDDIQKAQKLLSGENYSRMLISVNLPNEGQETSAFVRYLLDETQKVFGNNAHVAGEIVSVNDLSETFGKDNKLISIFTVISIFVIVLCVFRSLSLPVVLVTIIQGAIWISMSTSLITGPMFFMSYIVTTCILMGATIDYGILMSTNYVRYRATLNKQQALYKSVEAALPTVFTSGMILTVCGFVIAAVASQNAISAVGLLVGKGTLVCVIMITLVLPSVLYLLDNFILSLSWKNKRNK